MRYRVIKTEESELLSLIEVKEYLKTIPGDDSEDETVLRPLISAAREYCENLTGYALIPQTIIAYPEGTGRFENLPRVPVTEITRVTAVRDDGEKIALNNFEYDEEDGRFYLPTTPTGLRTVNPIEVEFTAGANTLPNAARQAMLLLIGHWYANRESVQVGNVTSVEIAETTKAILKQFRRWW